jgi:hypothetical protein
LQRRHCGRDSIFDTRTAASVSASGQLHGPVIVAMITMRMVQPAVYEIVDVVTMRHLFMSAVWTVCV